MDDILSQQLKSKQSQVKPFGSRDEMEMRYNEVKHTLPNQLDHVEKFVENQIFSGEGEKTAEEKNDFSRNYVYESFEQAVEKSNFEVARRIRKFGKADAREGQQAPEGEIQMIGNKAAKEAGYKKRKKENADLEGLREDCNRHADLNTVRELNSLDKYTSFYNKYFDKTKWDESYRNLVQTTAQQRNKSEAEIHSNLVFTAMPFLKTYEKGWFGRKYTLDGKRIKTKEGELSPDEYNDRLLRILALETNQGTLDEETLRRNRTQKAEVLGELTKELLSVKITSEMLTDEYMADHIGEMQQYIDKMNAFRMLYKQNAWFFKGNENAREPAKDPAFIDLVNNRIFRVSDQMNKFMDLHYRAHGMYRLGEYKYKEKGFPTKEEPDILTDLNGYREYVDEQQLSFGKGFDIYNEKELQGQDQASYQAKLEEAKSQLSFSIMTTSETISDYDRKQQKSVEGAVYQAIKGSMQEQLEECKKVYEQIGKDNEDLAYIPYDQLNQWDGGVEIADMKKRIEKNPGMYLFYGPEIEHIYVRLYASCRMAAELAARKQVLNRELKIDREKQKDKDGNLLTKFRYHSQNPYASFLNSYMQQDMRSHAQTELEGIDKKMEFLAYNKKLCKKVLHFFIENPAKFKASAEEREEIRNFLKKEKLDYMLDIPKIDVYADIMDGAYKETRQRIAQKDNGQNQPVQEPAAAEIALEERAQKIYNVRRRNQAINNFNQAGKNPIPMPVLYRKLFGMGKDIEKLNEFNHLKLETAEGAGEAYENVLIEQLALTIVRGQDKIYNMKLLADRDFMQGQLDIMAKEGVVGKNMDIDTFMAMCQTRIRILAKHCYVTNTLLTLQKNPNYAFFDMDRITAMTNDELETFIQVLSEKKDTQPEQAKELDELLGMVKTYSKARKQAGEYTVINSELVSHETRKLIRRLRLKRFKEEEFFQADQHYLDLFEFFQSEKFKAQNENHWPPLDLREEREKSEKPLDRKRTEEELDKKIREILNIPVDETLIKKVERITNEEEPLSEEILLELMRYSSAVRDMDIVLLEKDEDYEPKKLYVDMQEILNMPKNKKVKDTLKKRLEVLYPLTRTIENFLNQYNFTSYGKTWRQYGEKDLKTAEEKKKAQTRLQKAYSNMKKQFQNLKKGVSTYQNGTLEEKIQGLSRKLLEDLYQKGEKLSIGEMDKWKEKIKKMTKKGFFGENEDERWYRLAAVSMLDNWPYSFEQFYAQRIKKDTGKAVTVGLTNLLGKEGGKLIDAEHAGDVSAIISKFDTDRYHVLDENDTKEMERVLAANDYDKNLFTYLFKPVEVSGSGLPVDAISQQNRQDNQSLLSTFRSYTELDEKERKNNDNESVKQWRSEIVSVMLEVINFNLEPKMLEEEYIRDHFEELYKKTRQIAAAKLVYEKEKEFFRSNEVEEYLVFTPKKYKKRIEECFGTDKNQLFTKFYELVEAYGRMQLLDERGVFDLGLTNEEIHAGNLTNEKGKKLSEKQTKQQRLEKVKRTLEERREVFEKKKSEISREYFRNEVAKNVEKADALNQLGTFREIQGNDKLMKMVDMNSGGKVSDFNLLVQDQRLTQKLGDLESMKLTNEKLKEEYVTATKQIRDLQDANQEVPMELEEKKNALGQQIAAFQASLFEMQREIDNYKFTADKLHHAFDACHDTNGKLIYKRKEEDGQDVDVSSQFSYFHLKLADTMKKLFDEFEKSYETQQAMGKNATMMKNETISKLAASPDFAARYKDLRRLNLYFTLLEHDEKEIKTSFLDKKDPSYKTAVYLLDKALKKKDVLRTLHDYVSQIEAVIFEHGVKNNGELLGKDIMNMVGDAYNQDDKNDIIHGAENKGYEIAKEREKNSNS